MLPDAPHEVPPEIKKAMVAAATAQLVIDRLAALQNEEVTKYTGISRAELGLRVWNAPLAAVAKRLGIKKHVLVRICKLYEVLRRRRATSTRPLPTVPSDGPGL
jgi:hypothetical protein